VRAEGGELLVPLGLNLVHPGAGRHEADVVEREDTTAGISRVAGVGDEADLVEGAQVSAHDRRRDRGEPGELSGALRAPGQSLDRREPYGVAEGRESLSFKTIVHDRNISRY
jgi:hypothetical protein